MRVEKIESLLRKKVSKNIVCSEFHSSIVLEGEVDKWDDVIRAGKLAADKGYKGVVNRIRVKGLEIPKMKSPTVRDGSLEGKKFDVLIIGGGIIGCSIAREISKWDISIALVDKEEDVGTHTSSRNDGVVHPGIVPPPGSKKAFYNVRGNKMYTRISKELDIKFNRKGSLVLYDSVYIKMIKPLIIRRARRNGVKVHFLNVEQAKEIEPNITGEIRGAFFLPDTGVLSPYKTTIAYAENAAQNGVKFFLETVVKSMEVRNGKIISVDTNRGKIYPKVVINAAGNFADEVANMAGDQFFTIHPRKGEEVILDKKKGWLLNSIVSKLTINRRSNTKGGGLIKTVDGNILIGPNAYEQPYKEDYTTTPKGVDEVLNKHLHTIKGLSKNDVITYFAGTRAATYEEDFIVEKSEYVQNLIHVAGIQSPGIASAPAIAEDVEKMAVKVLRNYMLVKKKSNWNPTRKGIPLVNSLPYEERKRLIAQNPDYGVIICRCEEISKGEIIDAIHSAIPAKSLDSIKRRVGAGMGRCQGGFCTPLIMKIIHEESGMNMLKIRKKGGESYILREETKNSLRRIKAKEKSGER